MDVKNLYVAHIKELQSRFEKILEACQLDGLVIGCGPLRYYHDDDMSIPFRGNHEFLRWIPQSSAHDLVLIRPGEKPKLFHYAPDDFWYEQTDIGSEFWTDEIVVEEYKDVMDLWRSVSFHQKFAYVGEEENHASAYGLKTLVPTLVSRLHWDRSYKTPYEIAAMREANRQGAIAHRAARASFDEGGSEHDIFLAYLMAARCTEIDLPYVPIIGLDEKAAVLHYQHKRTERGDAQLLLIDAGINYLHYSSDITRTYVRDGKESGLAKELLATVQGIQTKVCGAIEAGITYDTLHHLCHLEVAQGLQAMGVLRSGVSAEELVENRVTRAFFPHGLGHMLGLAVHDAAGRQKNPEGALTEPSKKHPYLRSTRTIEPSHVFTIEPGIYFIELLLEPARRGKGKDFFQWPLIDKMVPIGGVRIEDNIAITDSGPVNLTREWLD